MPLDISVSWKLYPSCLGTGELHHFSWESFSQELNKMPVSAQLLLYKKEWAPHSLLAYSHHSSPFLPSSSDLMVKAT